MAEHSLWRFSRALHSAINERQPEDLDTQIDDDVDWVIYGPIELFPFLGARRGKAAVLEETMSIVRIITTRVNRHTRSTSITEPSARAQVSRKDANRITETITRKLEDVCQTRRPTVTLNAISAVTRRFRAAPSDLAPISRGLMLSLAFFGSVASSAIESQLRLRD